MKKFTLDPVAKAGIVAGGAVGLYMAYTNKANLTKGAGIVLGTCLIGFFAVATLAHFSKKSDLPGAGSPDKVTTADQI